MEAHAEYLEHADIYPVGIAVRPAIEGRNRLTAFFRFFLALPHIILVGGPVAAGGWLGWESSHGVNWQLGSGAGILGVVACFVAIIAWFAILFTGRYPEGLHKLASCYLRWRVRAVAYLTLLRDEYPPFGDGDYPAELVMAPAVGERDRVTVAFRLLLALPHLIVLALLSLLWAFTTALAWIAILVTGRYPDILYGFALGMMAWDIRVGAYMLLLRDEYPPFTLRS